jgi:DNA-binding MurR/RpiR family transcriptional regulator
MNKFAIDSAESCRDDNSSRISIAEQIHRHFSRLTLAERKVARLLQANYPIVGLEPLAGFARRAGVSHPSVLRFIAKLGYSGYPEFQAVLRSELEARLKSPLAKRNMPESEPSASDDLLARHAEVACDNIRQSIASLPRSEFESALALLGDLRNTVYLLGGRFTDSLANYIYMHLRVLRPRVEHVTGPPVSWSEYLLDMDRRAVLLVFDIRRYQQEVIRFAIAAAARGARIILMTDNWLSPIVAQAAHVLSARIEAPASWDSIVALGMLAEALIAGLSERTWSRLEQRIRELEHLRSHFEDTNSAS